jgi:hypothetical protein
MTVLLGALFQRQLRGYRFVRVERRFAADWSRLSPSRKREALARAYDAPVWVRQDSGAAELDRLMLFAVNERWRAMRRAGAFDFASLDADLGRVLGPAGRSR